MPLLPSILLRAARQTLALQDVLQGIASNLTSEDRGSTRVGAGQVPQQTGFGSWLPVAPRQRRPRTG